MQGKVPTTRASGANECLLANEVLVLHLRRHEITSSNNLPHPDQPPLICLIVYFSAKWTSISRLTSTSRIPREYAQATRVHSSDVRPGVQRGCQFVQQVHWRYDPLSYEQMLPRYANEAVKQCMRLLEACGMCCTADITASSATPVSVTLVSAILCGCLHLHVSASTRDARRRLAATHAV